MISHRSIEGSHAGKHLSLVITTFVLLLAQPLSHAVENQVHYIDWTNAVHGVPGRVEGQIRLPDQQTVRITYTGDVSSPTQISDGINYWIPEQAYLSATVPNAPTNSDIIALTGGTKLTNVIEFNPPVWNPVMLILSLGHPGLEVRYRFDQPFTLLSSGANWWGGSSDGLMARGQELIGYEGSGSIQFPRWISNISWTSTAEEYWHGFTLGIPDQPLVISTNAPPIVDILNPVEGQRFGAPATIRITAVAEDPEGKAVIVDFFANGQPIGTVFDEPFVLEWSGVPPGAYTLTAEAVDNAEAVTVSAPISITILPPPNPGGGIPCNLLANGDFEAGFGGSIVLLGQDADWHAEFGEANQLGARHIIQQGIRYVMDPQANPFVRQGARKFLLFQSEGVIPSCCPEGWTGGTNGFISSGFTMGRDFDRVDGRTLALALSELGRTYGALVVGSFLGSEVQRRDFAALNAQSQRIVEFLNAGGGVLSMTASAHDGQEPEGGLFGFLPFVISSEPINQFENGNVLTDAGRLFGLDETDINGNYSHNIFEGAFGLDVLSRDPLGRILSLAGRGIVIDSGIISPGECDPPVVVLTSPADGASFQAPASITLTATATDPDGVVRKVEFYQGATLLGEDTVAPFTLIWTNVAAGAYTLTARALDNNGLISTSAPVNVSVAAPDCSIEVYRNDFQGAVGSEWSIRTTDVTPVGARRFLGQFGNESARLRLAGLPPHSQVFISFELFVIRSWDGNVTSQVGPGPDEWTLSILGGPTLLRTTFNNVEAFSSSSAHPDWRRQSFPGNYPGSSNPARFGAAENNTLGYSFTAGETKPADSVYQLSFTIPHSTSLLDFDFSASGLQTLDDESWGLDNIVVTVCLATNLPPISIVGNIWRDVNANQKRDPDESGFPSGLVYLDLNDNRRFDPGEPSVSLNPEDNGAYVFDYLMPGRYIVRQVVPSGFLQTFPPVGIGSQGDGFADVILDFFDSGTGPIPGPYGSYPDTPRCVIIPVNPMVVLGPPPPSPIIGSSGDTDFLSLPSGSYVTVGFIDETVVDGPGNDIFIWSLDPSDSAGESADIYVSSDLSNFVLLGRAPQGGNVGLDLASIGFTNQVRAVRVVGVDNNGCFPGFELVSVQVLTNSIGPGDGGHIVVVNAGRTVVGVDFGNVSLVTNLPPIVRITQPANETTFLVGISIPIAADASDADGAVNRVEIYANDARIGSSFTNAPYSFLWTNAPLGTHVLTANARDDGGSVATSAPVIITVVPGNLPPSISAIPNQSTLEDTPTSAIAFTVSDAQTPPEDLLVTVASSNLMLLPHAGVVLSGGGADRALTLTPAPDQFGVTTITVMVRDAEGLMATNRFDLTVIPVNDPPVVVLTSPADGASFQAPASITLAATATDPDGVVSKVEFYQGATLLGEDTVAPFTLIWTNVAAGAYTLTARATDDDGLVTASSPVSITVAQALPPLSGQVLIIQNQPGPEIELMKELIETDGYTYQVVSQDGLFYERVADFEVYLWADGGQPGVRDHTVHVLSQAFNAGKHLYFVGEHVPDEFSRLGPDARGAWRNLTHLDPSRVRPSQEPVLIEIDPSNEERLFGAYGVVQNGRFGAVPDFGYPQAVPGGTALGQFGETVLGRAGGQDALLSYHDPVSRSRVISQVFQLLPTVSDTFQESRERLFRNAVWWLLNGPDCPTLDFYVLGEAPSEPVQTGEELTYELEVIRERECAGRWVILENAFSAPVAFVRASNPYGTVEAGQAGNVIFKFPYVDWSIGAVSLTVRPLTPGVLINQLSISAGAESNLNNNQRQFETRIEGRAPAPRLSISGLPGGDLELRIIEALPGVIYLLERASGWRPTADWQPYREIIDEPAGSRLSPTNTHSFFRVRLK